MQPPQVQSIEQIIQDQSGAYQPGIDLIGKKQALLPEKFKAAQMGLDAAKVTGFNQINNQATARGMSFSGIPLDEQAQYLSEKYLPGMQQLQFQQNEEEMAFTGALAEIEKERRLGAFGTREKQQSSLEGYLQEQRQMAWEKEKMNIETAQRRAEQAAQQADDAGPTVDQWLADEFDTYSQADKDWLSNYTTEDKKVSNRLSSYFGISLDEAKKLTYGKRRDWYGS